MSLTAVWNQQKTVNFKIDQQKVSNPKTEKDWGKKWTKLPGLIE